MDARGPYPAERSSGSTWRSLSPGDRVVIDGRDVTSRLSLAAAAQVLLYHKPQGQPIGASASEEDAGSMDKSVMESLPSVRGARWLVINTMQAGDSGLMLVTNDGRLADGLRRRAETIPAAYVARVLVPAEFDVESLPRLVQYDDEAVEFQSVEPAGGEGTNRWFRVESQRAHRRAAVRALFESCGLKVSRVIQVKFADLELPRDLPRGKHRALSRQAGREFVRASGAGASDRPGREKAWSRRPQPRWPSPRACSQACYWQSKVCPVTPLLSAPRR